MTRTSSFFRSARLAAVAVCGISVTAGLTAGLTACKSDNLNDITRPDLAALFWTLDVNAQAVTVAVGGQQQLTAIPRTVDGTAITDLPTPTWASTDTTKVKVDQNGLVHGVGETGGATVTATLTGQGITYVDSVTVAVTAQPAAIAGLELSPGPGNRTLGIGDFPAFLMVSAVDADDNPIPGVAISLTLATPGIATLYAFGGGAGQLQANALGQTRVVASTTSYGTTFTDTVVFSNLYGVNGTVSFSANGLPGAPVLLQPTTVVIGVGGSVTWSNYGAPAFNVTFTSGGDQVVGGDIPDIGPTDPPQRRTFPAAGTYNYKDTHSGLTGSVVVREQPTY